MLQVISRGPHRAGLTGGRLLDVVVALGSRAIPALSSRDLGISQREGRSGGFEANAAWEYD
jgi:hypothetical protein